MLIASWAEVDFLYEKMLDKKFEVIKVNVSHHKDWFTENRSIVKNTLHLVFLFCKLSKLGFNQKSVFFGSNLCRLFFWKKKAIFIYNEMPELERKNVLFYIDKFIFKFRSNRVFVSNVERLKMCNDYYGVITAGVLPNIPMYLDLSSRNNIDKTSSNIIYAGMINENRLNNLVISTLNSNGFVIDACGLNLLGDKFIRKVNYLGNLSSEQLMSTLSHYQYALLSYSMDDVNNFLCAPIKIYDYISSGCVCVVVNKNKSLVRLCEEYPDLFCLLDKFKGYVFNLDAYNQQAERFFETEMESLNEFIETVIKT